MSLRHTEVDPVIPRYCAQTGAALPLAWEFAWSERSGAAPVRLTPPPPPREVDRATWPRRLDPGARIGVPPGVRLDHTPVPFLNDPPHDSPHDFRHDLPHDGGPVAVLFGTDPAAFVEVPEAVGALLPSGPSVADVRRAWGRETGAVDHALVGLLRFGLLSGGPAPLDRPEQRHARVPVQEAWVRATEPESGVHVLAHTPTGAFLRVGTAALGLWRQAGERHGVRYDRLPGKLHPVADRMLSAGMLRAVRD
ncbi:hypothetical protein [Streptomyces sp. NPDC046909]|uniref:hypothetical protein n=1 Tax=Streptomyces sp. NPDC046909 TaxID=3155617 RepID=UPI0033D22AA7